MANPTFSANYYSLQMESFQALMKHIQDCPVHPQPYYAIEEVIADLALIGANCIYVCGQQPQDSEGVDIGNQLIDNLTEIYKKQSLNYEWLALAKNQDFLSEFNTPVRSEFDDADLDQFSENTLRELANILGVRDSSATRDIIDADTIVQAGEFIHKRLQQSQGL